MTTDLIFQDTKFDVIDRNGQPWVRVSQIATALDYSSVQRVTELYTRHADEFTDAMTAVVKLETPGGLQDVRIFSLRGCHLLAMFAKTPVAKEFRKWVLDILDKEAEAARNQAQQTEAEPTITPQQQRQLHNIVNARVAELPEAQRRQAYKYAWGTLNRYFGIAKYSQLPQSKMEGAVRFLQDLQFPTFETESSEQTQEPEARHTIHISKEEMDKWYKQEIEREKQNVREAIDEILTVNEKALRRLSTIRHFSLLLR